MKIRTIGAFIILFGMFAACSRVDENGSKKDVLSLVREAMQTNQYTKALVLLKGVHDKRLKTPEYYLMEGRSFFKLGGFKQALAAYKKVDSPSMDLQIEMVYLSLLLGDAKGAIDLSDALVSQFGAKPEINLLRGNIYLKKESFERAEQYYRLALKQDPNFIKAYIGLANTHLLQRSFVEAEAQYVKAVSLSKKSPVADIALANYYLSTGRIRDAEAHLQGALKAHPDDINLSLALSGVYVRKNNFADANEIYLKALKLYPDSLDIKVRAIKTYLDLEKREEAFLLIQGLLDAGRDEDKKNERYHGFILLGEYHLRAGALDKALSSFNKALVVSSASYEVNYYLGLTHLLQNKVRLSKQFLKKSIKSYPGFSHAHLLLASLYLSSKRYSLASEHAKFVLKLDPNNTAAHAINGIALYLSDHLKEAQYEFEVLKTLDAENNLLPLFNAMTAISHRDFAQAENHISKIDHRFADRLFLELALLKQTDAGEKEIARRLKPYLDHQPGFLPNMLIGDFYKESGDLTAAVRHVGDAILLNQNNVTAHYLMAEIEAKKGNLTSAIDSLNRAIEVNPQFLKSYQALGVLYEKTKDYQNAKRVYEQGLIYHPEDGMLLNNLSWILLNHFQEKTTAYSYIRKAIVASPEDAQVNDTLAWWYHLNGEHQKAIEILDELVRKKPKTALYRYHLGMSYFKNDASHLAEAQFKKALALQIGGKQKAEIINTLKRISEKSAL